MASNELGSYLRSRREAVKPADVGLPEGGRRRTPGLRREELATLAGVSVDYLIRLEQGRDRNPSGDILAALADVLRLTVEERRHLMVLAKISTGVNRMMCVSSEPNEPTVRRTVRALLDHLEPAPAVILDSMGDLLAFTQGYASLVDQTGLLDDESPNVVRFLFTDDRAGELFPDWDSVVEEYVAHLRIGSFADDTVTSWFVDEMRVTSGPDFSTVMDRPAHPPALNGTEKWCHPEVGALELDFETFDVTGTTDQRVVVYLAADEATATALDHLNGRRPRTLRVVQS